MIAGYALIIWSVSFAGAVPNISGPYPTEDMCEIVGSHVQQPPSAVKQASGVVSYECFPVPAPEPPKEEKKP